MTAGQRRPSCASLAISCTEPHPHPLPHDPPIPQNPRNVSFGKSVKNQVNYLAIKPGQRSIASSTGSSRPQVACLVTARSGQARTSLSVASVWLQAPLYIKRAINFTRWRIELKSSRWLWTQFLEQYLTSKTDWVTFVSRTLMIFRASFPHPLFSVGRVPEKRTTWKVKGLNKRPVCKFHWQYLLAVWHVSGVAEHTRSIFRSKLAWVRSDGRGGNDSCAETVTSPACQRTYSIRFSPLFSEKKWTVNWVQNYEIICSARALWGSGLGAGLVGVVKEKTSDRRYIN